MVYERTRDALLRYLEEETASAKIDADSAVARAEAAKKDAKRLGMLREICAGIADWLTEQTAKEDAIMSALTRTVETRNGQATVARNWAKALRHLLALIAEQAADNDEPSEVAVRKAIKEIDLMLNRPEPGEEG